jgi:UDP-N-acetylglucosamine 2-epimerase (non-hydrolysing)
MKIAPIVSELQRHPDAFESLIVHTGQHYDDSLSGVFFDQLGIPAPTVNLNVGSGTHAQQTAAVMAAFEPVLLEHCPDVVLVVGDVNSTLACALVAVKLEVAVAHVEAGLRSYDRRMPEEVNRVLTDQISDLLFTTEAAAACNLEREGIARDKVHFVGNVMIDTLLRNRVQAIELDVPRQLGLCRGSYAVLTLHRPSNVDRPDVFDRLVKALEVIAKDVPIVFPVHPRTRSALSGSCAARRLIETGRLKVLDPFGYLEFLGLVEASRIVLTDSGGLQEETTILGVPCLTLRENTERPATVKYGTNRVVGTTCEGIINGWREALETPKEGNAPPLWDGAAAARIVSVLRAFEAR